MHRLLAFLVLTAFACVSLSAEPDEGPRIKKMMQPAAEIPTEYEWWGQTRRIQLKDYRKRVVLLHFWTVDDLASDANLVHYNRWKSDYEAKGFAMIGVHVPVKNRGMSDIHWKAVPDAVKAQAAEDEKKVGENARERAKLLAPSFPTIFAKDNTYPMTLGGKKEGTKVQPPGAPVIDIRDECAIPVFFLIDRKGNLRYMVEGVIAAKTQDWSKPIEAKIEALLKEAKE